MNTFDFISRIRDIFLAERGVVPGLASWRRRSPAVALAA